ncbi:primosomal protein [Pseudonocardia oceani]|uniref:Primosomal protein n=1 Tax=Pseudonocardia oceani TaxID=2792013 RepID=A0ABS6U7H6_9PSEU|nr:primosomal protein [Pseudonocardia oceani]MBW0120717.1 primosomal protein [Pseudonocardia oceani]MBW0127859.1 primosomal protein [Pseudonocardia oceani]
MASDIVPIQLSLTEGDLVTLWAPRWREDGEEWEAFLGDDDALFAFPEVAQLAAFVRTAREHDLVDHPAWSVVPDLTVAELTPEETQTYDVIGVPELAAEEADQWTIGELHEIVGMVRSIADVCELDVVTEVLDSAPGFGLLHQGTLPFVGREGGRLWAQLVAVIAERWDDVVDALDDLVDTPDVDPAALGAARKEEVAEAAPAPADALLPADDTDEQDEDVDPDVPVGFWDEVGIHPIRITTRDGEFVTLRCFIDDTPLFLGSGGTIEVFGSERALARWIAEDGADGHDLTAASTWVEVVDRAAVGELEVEVDPLDTYVLTGLADDIGEGVVAVDGTQLERAVELIRDVAEWAGDDEPAEALAESQPLGWLVSFVVRPNPTRLAPSAPFDRESERFRGLVDDVSARLHVH